MQPQRRCKDAVGRAQVYLSKHLCKDQFCRDEKFPILDYNDSTKEP